MATMAAIEDAAKRYATARQTLVEQCVGMQREFSDVKSKHIGSLKVNVGTAKERHAELHAMIAESANLFVKPKSVIFHGVKVGYQKAKGKIEIEDEERVMRLIRKNFPDQVDLLINTTEKPVKKALEQLSAADLKKLGIEITETGDVVFIKDTAAEVDKLVEAFLKDESAEEAS